MLEREQQHSHRLEQRLQQVEADALEVSCLLVTTCNFPSLIHLSLHTPSKEQQSAQALECAELLAGCYKGSLWLSHFLCDAMSLTTKLATNSLVWHMLPSCVEDGDQCTEIC